MRADKSLSPFEIRVYRHYRIVHGTRVALAFLLTFLIIRLFTIPESTWPLVTMVVIMGPSLDRYDYPGSSFPDNFFYHRLSYRL